MQLLLRSSRAVRLLVSGIGLVLASVAVACAPQSPPPDAPSDTPSGDGTTDEGSAAPASSATSTGDETQPASGETSAEGPASVFVVHQVPDFAAYVRQFEGNAATREKAGVSRAIVARVADDPSRVAVHFSVRSLGHVEAFLKSNDYERLIEKDQATSSTLLWVASDELVELPAEIQPGSVSLFAKFPVKDAACLVRALAAGQSELYAEGLLGFSLHGLASDAGVSILHLLASDRPTVERIYAGKQFTSLLSGCGAAGPKQPLVANNYSKD